MNQTLRILPNKSFDYINTGNPSATTNPEVALVTWLNATTGVIWVCIDNTTDANVWTGGYRGALLYRTTNQSIPNALGTKMSWDAEDHDTDGFHESVTNPTRITVPSGVSRVKLFANIEWTANANGERLHDILKNGGVVLGGGSNQIGVPSGTHKVVTGVQSAVLDVVEGDYFEVSLYQSSGIALNIDATDGRTWFSIEVIE